MKISLRTAAALALLAVLGLAAWWFYFRSAPELPRMPPPPAASSEKGAAPAEPEKPPIEAAAAPGKAIATVNGVPISWQEWELRVARRVEFLTAQSKGKAPSGEEVHQLGADILNKMIEQEMAWQAAVREGYTASPEDVALALQMQKMKFNEEEQFQAALRHQQITEEGLKHDLARMITIKNFLDAEIHAKAKKEPVTEEMVRQRYEQMERFFRQKNPGQEPPSFDEMKAQIRGLIEQQRREAREYDLYQMLHDQAKVEVFREF
jgi:hypothetical protein